MPASYSAEPMSTIDVASLKDSCFLLREERRYAYRDSLGRINLHLLRKAEQQLKAEGGPAPRELQEKLSTWIRHAERWAEGDGRLAAGPNSTTQMLPAAEVEVVGPSAGAQALPEAATSEQVPFEHLEQWEKLLPAIAARSACFAAAPPSVSASPADAEAHAGDAAHEAPRVRPNMRFIGILKPVQGAGATDGAVQVDAVIMPFLMPNGGGGSSSTADGGGGGSSNTADGGGGGSSSTADVIPHEPVIVRPEKRKSKQATKTHYVCTATNCGWSGSSRTRHTQFRPNCNFVPCAMGYPTGEPTQPLVEAFLARCTEEQRRQGLPPDGERALMLDEYTAAAVIPEGCGVGDRFSVRIDKGAANPRPRALHT